MKVLKSWPFESIGDGADPASIWDGPGPGAPD